MHTKNAAVKLHPGLPLNSRIIVLLPYTLIPAPDAEITRWFVSVFGNFYPYHGRRTCIAAFVSNTILMMLSSSLYAELHMAEVV